MPFSRVCISTAYVRSTTVAAYMCVRVRLPSHNLPPSYTPHLLACVECTYLHHDDIHAPSHRTCQSYAIRRKCRRARPQARTRTPAGSIDSCKPASRTTKPSPTNASEDYVIIALQPSVYRLCNHYTPTICQSHPYMVCFAFQHRHTHHP